MASRRKISQEYLRAEVVRYLGDYAREYDIGEICKVIRSDYPEISKLDDIPEEIFLMILQDGRDLQDLY